MKLPINIFLFLFFVQSLSAQSGPFSFLNNINGTNPSSTNPFSSGQIISPNTSSTGIGHVGVVANAGTDRYNCNNWQTSSSISLGKYITWIIIPNSGYKISFQSLSLTIQCSSTGPDALAVRSNVDNYASNLYTASGIQGFSSSNPQISNHIIDLSSITNRTTPTIIRLYGYDASGINGTMSVNDFNFMGTLPIKLLSFTAKTIENKTQLSFSTATEENNDYFSIERSSNGIDFRTIGKVTGAGTTTSIQKYTFLDENPFPGTNYYRLKQVDFDGQFTYSPVVTVQFDGLGGFRLFPVPVKDQLQLQLDEPDAFESQWAVYNALGQLVLSGILPEDQSTLDLNVSDLAPGMYWLQRTSGRARNSRMFVKE